MTVLADAVRGTLEETASERRRRNVNASFDVSTRVRWARLFAIQRLSIAREVVDPPRLPNRQNQ